MWTTLATTSEARRGPHLIRPPSEDGAVRGPPRLGTEEAGRRRGDHLRCGVDPVELIVVGPRLEDEALRRPTYRSVQERQGSIERRAAGTAAICVPGSIRTTAGRFANVGVRILTRDGHGPPLAAT